MLTSFIDAVTSKGLGRGVQTSQTLNGLHRSRYARARIAENLFYECLVPV